MVSVTSKALGHSKTKYWVKPLNLDVISTYYVVQSVCLSCGNVPRVVGGASVQTHAAGTRGLPAPPVHKLHQQHHPLSSLKPLSTLQTQRWLLQSFFSCSCSVRPRLFHDPRADLDATHPLRTGITNLIRPASSPQGMYVSSFTQFPITELTTNFLSRATYYTEVEVYVCLSIIFGS